MSTLRKEPPKLTPTTIRVPTRTPTKVKRSNSEPRKVIKVQQPPVQYIVRTKPATKTRIVSPMTNMHRQQPAGIVTIRSNTPGYKAPPKEKKKRDVYYSSEEEELGQIRKIYKNDYRYRNFYLCNICKGCCANRCPTCNCFEWFYGCPMWFYLAMALLLLALLIAFIILLVMVINAQNNPTPVVVTKTYNKTYGVTLLACGVGCTTYSTVMITQGYMSGQLSSHYFSPLSAWANLFGLGSYWLAYLMPYSFSPF